MVFRWQVRGYLIEARWYAMLGPKWAHGRSVVYARLVHGGNMVPPWYMRDESMVRLSKSVVNS